MEKKSIMETFLIELQKKKNWRPAGDHNEVLSMAKTTLSKARSTFALFHKSLLKGSQWISLTPFRLVAVVAQMIENLPTMQETRV